MDGLDWPRFFLGFSVLLYASWTDLTTRRVPNQVWLISGSIALLLLIYEIYEENWEYYVWALLFSTIILFYNAFVDEYVLDANQVIFWQAAQVLALLSALYFFMTVNSDQLSKNNYKLLDIISISFLMILMYLWFYLGPTIGGADVKAVMTIGLITPFTLTFGSDAFTAFETRGFPYPFVVFMNSLLFYLFIPLGFAFYNVIKGNFERPYFQLFFGTKMALDQARQSFVWPMEQVVGGRVVLVAFVKNKRDYSEQWKELEELGIDNPWVTYKIPYIVPLAISFALSAFLGDLFSHYLVYPLTSFFS